MKLLIIFLMLSTVAVAQTIADYPIFLLGNDFYIIKGDMRNVQEISAANTIAINFPATQFQLARSTRRASEISVLDRPAVLVGTPCSNRWVARVLNLSKCNVISASDGIIAVTTYNNQPVVIVTGGSPAAVFGAAQWLTRGGNQGVQSNFIRLVSAAGFSRTYVGKGYYIGNRQLLSIGQPISQVTPVIILGSQRLQGTTANAYLRPGNGKVIFGKRDNS
jgi:hypothetical protein